MGRRKRALHPWSPRDLAIAECFKSLGEDAAREAVECFTTVSLDSSEYGPSSDQFIPWMSDLLSGVERKYDIRITGRLATSHRKTASTESAKTGTRRFVERGSASASVVLACSIHRSRPFKGLSFAPSGTPNHGRNPRRNRSGRCWSSSSNSSAAPRSG